MNKKQIYAMLLKCIAGVFGKKSAKVFDARVRFGRKLDLDHPKTLADKVSWLSIYEHSDLIVTCTDKYDVHQYVTEKGLGDILLPVVGGPWSCVEEIDLTALPEKFILKATHGCKMNYPVPDKKNLDLRTCMQEMQKWLDTTYGTYSMEPHYARIPHRIYAEKLIENASDLVDYKIHCMNGEPQFILVCSDRKADGENQMSVTLDLFDIHWNPISGLQPYGKEIPGSGKKDKPLKLDEMLQIAKVLSADFKFVRVDFYEVEGKVRFGELTFTPACGVFACYSEAFIEEMGDKLAL